MQTIIFPLSYVDDDIIPDPVHFIFKNYLKSVSK